MKTHTLMIFAACIFSTSHAWSQPGGCGMGPGNRGNYGPGMMGGYGHGMMGGYGHGMMDGYALGFCDAYLPELTKEQQNKVSAIQKEFRQKQWALMEKMYEDRPSGSLYEGGKFDEQAARKAFDARANLHKQMFENSLDAHKRIDAILTSQQREQLQRGWSRR